VHGAVRGASFTVYVDGQAGNSSSSASNASAGILAELSNMSAGRHEIVLYVDSVDSNGQLDFSRVVFDAGLRRYVSLSLLIHSHNQPATQCRIKHHAERWENLRESWQWVEPYQYATSPDDIPRRERK